MTVVIIASALGSILYVSPMLLRQPAPTTTEATHVVEYGVKYYPYLFDSTNNGLLTDLHPHWLRVPAPDETSAPYTNFEKLMRAFPEANILMVIGPPTMGIYAERCTFSRLNTFQKKWVNARISSCGWSLQDWDANVTRLVKAFPNVHAWEIWDGPDFNQGGYLCCDNNVALLAHHYFDMLRDAYQIIKAQNPNATVIAFSVSLFTEGAKDGWIKQLVQEALKLGASNYFDAVSFQAYPADYPLYEVDHPGSSWDQQMPTLQALTGKPVWITSTAIPSNDVTRGATPQTQATYLTQAFTFLSHFSYVKVIIWNCFYDPTDPTDISLLTINPVQQQTPKPAYYAFQNFTKNQTTTASTST